MTDHDSPPPAGSRAGAAYLVSPDDGPGPGVLVLSSWWGLTRSTKDVVESLADAGYTALAPDLVGDVPESAEQAQQALEDSDPNETAAFIISSVVALRAHSADPEAPVAVIGYSMGASWALWLATRQPDSVDAVVAYYGVQNIDFDDLRAPVLGHYAEFDGLVSDDDLNEMHARILLSERSVDIRRYPGTRHWFAEADHEEFHDAAAAALAWQRTLDFLATTHPSAVQKS